MGEDKPYARAYFSDKENKVVLKYANPPQVSEDHRTYTSMPAVFRPKQDQKVSFPIGLRAMQAKEKWSRVVIVFGDKTFAVAETFPKDDVSKFDFPEKELVLKSAKAPTPAR